MNDQSRMTLRDAAERAKHSPVSLRQAAQRGSLEAVKVGEGRRATYYVTWDAVRRYLARRRTWKTYHEPAQQEAAE